MAGEAAAGGDTPAQGRPRPELRLARILLVLGLSGCALLAGLLPRPWSFETGPGFAAVPERPFEQTVLIAIFWAAVLALPLLGLLLATSGLWTRRLTQPLVSPGSASVQPTKRPARALLLVVLAAIAIGGVLRWPVAHGSFWWDEGWSIIRVVRGLEAPNAEDPRILDFEGRNWARTFWYWKKPTNHVLYNIAGRLSLDGWRHAGGHPPGAFDEFVFRFPAYLAALLTIGGVGLFGWRAGYPAAGGAAAVLLALHPWAARYSVDGRAYAFLIPLALAAVLALTEAIRRGRWPAWLAFGAAQLGLLWTHPFMIYLSVGLFLAALAGIRGVAASARDRTTLLLRMLAANALAGVAFLLVMAPNLAQIFIWDDEANGRPLNGRILKELWSRLATGLSHHSLRPDSPQVATATLESIAAGIPGLEALVFVGLPLLGLLGLARVVRDRGAAALPLLALFATVGVSMAIVHATGQLYYHRFYAFAVWALLFCFMLGLETLARLALPRRPAIHLPALAALVIGLVALASPQIAVVWSRPIAPLRDVAERTRSLAGADPTSVIRLGYGLGGGMPRIYDPWIRAVASREEIAEQIARAESEARPLYVFYGHPEFNRKRRPAGFELLDDPAKFQLTETLLGIEPRFTYRVLCYRGTNPSCAPTTPTARAAP